MTKSLSSLSHPATVRPSDDTVPSERFAKGYVCPRCKRAFGEDSALHSCPDDRAPLLRAADVAAAAGDPMLGRVLANRFTILARLGAGSMGTVYRARQAPIAREVAIKILRSDRAIDEVSRARFLREARANSLLTSPNTVTVFDFGQSESGEFYLAMELLEGESLGQRMKRNGRIPLEEAIDTAKQALRSLAEAHAKGIVHRDLKPDNLFFARVRTNETYEEIVKVLDFGIAKMLHAEGEPALNVIETQAGTVFGTPRYMSPEQAQGKPLDARSDLYSLGVILYHMLSGRPPFTDDDAIVVMARHIKTPVRPLSEVAPDARIPPEVEALVMRVLSKEPEKRPQTADALMAELSRLREAGAVTSGVRASISPAAELALDRGKSLPPPPATPSALTYDTLSVPAGVASAPRRRTLVMGLLGGVAIVATLAFAALHRRSPLVVPNEARVAIANDAPPASVSPASPAALETPPAKRSAPVQTALAAPAATTVLVNAPVPAPSSTSNREPPRVEPSHLERRPSRTVHAPAPARPAGSSPSVGYGYLE